MAQKPGTRNFSGAIPTELKESIDEQIERTKIPIGVAVLRLAEFWEGMDDEEQKLFCYGVNQTTFKTAIRQVVLEVLSEADPDALAGRIVRTSGADAREKKQKSHRRTKRGGE